MSTPKPQNEPTMEEILASIRKIISEDAEAPAKPGEAPAAAPSAPAAAPTPAAPAASRAASAPPAEAREDVLELTDMVKDDGSVEKVKQPSEELVMTDSQPEPAAPPRPAAAPDNELLSSRSAAAAASALAGLAGAAAATRGMALGNGQKTIEDIVRELLRPMLKDWLDANLPPLVERLVQREIAKLAGHVDDR
jgi:uncharacterized protein